MFFERIKDFIMGTLGMISRMCGKLCNKNEQITLAVVGIPHSGKSYLLSDIITSYRNMGYVENKLERDGVMYQNFSKYKAKIERDGRVLQTEVYPLRPGENIYGAKLVKRGGKTLELVFADIPGEVFNSKSGVENLTNNSVYSDYCDQLRVCGKAFQVTVWKNDAQNELKVVEPIIKNEDDRITFDGYKTDSNDIDENMFKARNVTFLDWKYLYSWLKANGYKAEEKNTTITGRELLKHFFEYQPDSLMRSLAYKVATICPQLNISKTDFESNYLMTFYFLHYCKSASDIVVCDKLLVPQDANDKGEDIFTNYQVMITGLADFVNRQGLCNVYLAFRGVDFMIKNIVGNYQKLYRALHGQVSNNKFRNFVYSLFAYLLWNRVDETNQIEDTETLAMYLGMKREEDENYEDFALDELKSKYIDMTCGNGRINGETNNKEQALIDLIKPHIGDDGAHGFMQLLNIAHHYHEPTEGYMRRMPPHIYFTSTPITTDFKIYDNDPAYGNQRFVNNEMTGAMKYFDTAGSHLCFGSYQLCIDILSQHGESVVEEYELNDLLKRSTMMGS